MFTKRIVSIIVGLLLALNGGARAANLYVASGSTHTVTGNESYDQIYVAGTLVIESSGNLTASLESTLNGPGAQIIVNGGAVTINARFNVGKGSDGYITMNGGTFTVTGTFKFPDDPGGVHRIYLNAGTMHSGDIQLIAERDAVIEIDDGILQLDNVISGDPTYDPWQWVSQDALNSGSGAYGDVIDISPFGPTGAEIRAVPPPAQFQWDLDGTYGNALVSDTDNIAGLVATKFRDSGGPSPLYDVRYGVANPWYNPSGTSADLQNDPTTNDPGVGLFALDGGVDSPLDLTNLNTVVIEAYVYPYDLRQAVIIRKYGGDGVYYIDTRPTGHFGVRLAGNGEDTGDLGGVCYDLPFVANDWYHVKVIWAKGAVRFYVNGVQSLDLSGKAEIPFQGPIGDSTGALGIGCIVRDNLDPPANSGQFFNGRIDELKISGVVGPVPPAPGIWTNADPTDNSWCTPGNWTGNAVPDQDDEVSIEPLPTQGPVVAAGCNPHVYQIRGPIMESGDDQVMDVIGGTMLVDNTWHWAWTGGGTATLNITGTPSITVNGMDEGNENLHFRGAEWTTGIVNICGNPTINVPNGFFRGGDKQGSRFIVNMNGGTLNCKKFRLGDEGICDLNLSNGTINVESNLTLSVLRGLVIPQQALNITGGSIIVGGTFWPVWGLAGTGTVNLRCGTIECAAFEHGWKESNNDYGSDPTIEAPYSMDIEQGQFIISGDVTADVQADIDAGYITAFGGADTIVYDYGISNPGKTTVRAASWTGCDPPEPQCTVPEADAMDNIQITTADQACIVVQGVATDPEGDPLLYRWLEGENQLLDWTSVGPNGEAYLDLGTLPLFSTGDHVLTLEVKDPRSAVTDEMILTIDNSPPEAQPVPSSQVVEINVDDIVLNADVSDFDGDTLDYQWLKETNVLASGSIATTQGGDPVAIPELLIPASDPRFPLGTYTLELLVSDGINELIIPVTVTVDDSIAPTISPVADTTMLWPPNHELHQITIQANAFDDGCPPVTLTVTVTSSEPPDTDGDGNTIPDFYIDSVDDGIGIILLRLRAERSGKGDGRIYTVTITATDNCQNSSEAIVDILAPHDKRRK